MKMKLRFTLLLMLIASISFGQSLTGGVAGKVINEQGKPMDYASVQAIEGGIVKGGSYTDEDGFYSIKPLSAGTYTIKVTYLGYPSVKLENVLVAPSKTAKRNITMKKKQGANGQQLKEITITSEKLIDATNPATDIKSGKDLTAQATTNLGDMMGTFAGVKQTGNGAAVSIGGGRTDGTQYFIDGVPVLGSRAVNLSPRALGSAQVMRTGMSAKFGNATGGVIQLTSAPVSSKTSGGLQVQTSVDGYFNNLVSLDLSGPLYTVNKDKAGERVKLGYFLNVAGRYNKDSDPSYDGYQVLKESVLAGIEETPLLANPSGGGAFLEAAETVTAADFRQIKAREQGDNWNINYLGKLDYQPTQKINLTLGTFFDYTRFRNFSRLNGMFAPAANGTNNSYTGRAYLRFSQSLGRTQTAVKDTDIVKSAFSNAFYTVQLSYQRDYSDGGNPVHGRNIFDYGYVGQFTQERQSVYSVDTALGYVGLKFRGDQSTGLNFTRGGVNPLLENYTDQVMNNPNFDITNLVQLQSLGGLINGSGPSSAYSLFTGPGSQVNTFSYGQEDRVNLNLDAAFDLEQGMKNRGKRDPIVHSIEFGMGYEQRTNRNYFNSAAQMWTLMRLFTNSHLQNLDVNNPIFVVDGQEYSKQQLDDGVVQFSEFDTIRYNRLPVADDQSRFDKSLREKLFGDANATNFIDVFDLDRSTFTLDMFSPDDLFNSGSGFATNYNGYDYLGNIQRDQPSFSDFWTKRDGRGDFARPIAAYSPNYMFGYIQDNFTYKDINFNIGVRFDRFDANQNVLRDPYSLYGVNKLGVIDADNYKFAFDEATRTTAPNPKTSGFDEDWVPYVDNNQAGTPTLVGYRDGDVWYDPFGREIADPTVLSEKYANGLPIQPVLTDPSDSIKSENYKINNAFEDYTPDVTLSPRIQFTFPISDKSLFYGNYDIVTQYPRSRNFVNPSDYFFITERNPSSNNPMNNANLRMSRSINYTLGFEQAITERSKIGLEVAYSERKDQVQLQQYILAFPIAYTSFGNRDFSSTKRFIFKYDLRRSRKKYTPLSINVAYTLQFAEGTGSSETSAQSLIATGQPNLRTVFPLSVDTRHQFSFVFDYRFGDNVGPKFTTKNGKEHYWLRGVAANLLVNANSGDPFTRAAIATPIVGGDFNGTPIVGTRNGSRRPWNQELGLRLQKSMPIARLGRKKDTDGNILTESGRPMSINVFTFVQNLLNTRNIVGVYAYTGVADDDGYLTSPQGEQFLNSGLLFPQSYQDIYTQRMLNPNNFGRPRRINVGFTLSF